MLFATLPYFTNLRECKIAMWLPGDRKSVLRQMIASFVNFGGEWLVENKELIKVLWPSSAIPIYPPFLWRAFDEKLERKRLGLPFRSNAYIKEVERCIDTIRKSKQGYAINSDRKALVAKFEEANEKVFCRSLETFPQLS